jgi:WD40 repeat protein/serine/threonine protein kinase
LRAAIEDDPGEEEPAEQDDGALRFGPYTTLRVLGEGGMGVVYLAEQEEPIRRVVALKVLKAGLEFGQADLRFEAERQALALMNHPAIARVYDAGTAGGRPFFAMEYFAGVPLTEFCDAGRLNVRRRLELFKVVCLAVHHAHQKGIIHRDIKPSNVLAAEQGGETALKVIDFGVAKALYPGLTPDPIRTQQGVLFGTPSYMSPEQAELGVLEVDATSDIYSLGVMLYELLTGTLPLEVERQRDSGYLAMLRVILEVEPPTPDAKVRALGPEGEATARKRGTDVRRLARQLRGELAWIVMRALEKERGRRYASASELAADVERYLNGEPLQAGPPSRVYRIRKLLGKHRAETAALAALLLSLMLGVTASTKSYLAEQRERDVAERQSYAANLASAEAQLAGGGSQRAREALFQCVSRLRGWEWNLLYAMTDNSTRVLQAGGQSYGAMPPKGQIAFEPGGGRVFLRMAYSTHSWETKKWKADAPSGLFGEILAMAGDGAAIATRDPDGRRDRVLILQLPSGTRLAELDGNAGVTAAAFSARGTRLAMAGEDGRLRVWNWRTRRLQWAKPAERGEASQVRIGFSGDGERLACARHGTVQVLNAATGRILSSKTGLDEVIAFAFRPDGKRLAMVDAAGKIREWDPAHPREPDRVSLETDECLAVAYSPDGSRIVTAGRLGPLRIWSAGRLTALGALTGMAPHRAAAVAFDPSGKLVLAAGSRGELLVWDLENQGGGVTLRSGSQDLSVSPDLKRFAEVTEHSTVLRDGATGRIVGRIEAGGRRVAVSDDGRWVALTDDLGELSILDGGTGAEKSRWSAHAEEITAIAVSPGSRLLATSSRDKTVKIWDAETGANKAKIEVAEEVNAVAFSPDAKLVAIGAGANGRAVPGGAGTLWDAATGRMLRRLEPEWEWGNCVQALAFSPSGNLVAVGECFTGTVRLSEVASGRAIADLKGHAGEVLSLSFSPGGGLLASGSRDGTIRLWDVPGRKPLLVLRGLDSPPQRLAFGTGGRRLMSLLADGTIRSWSTDTSYPSRAVELLTTLLTRFGLWSDVRHSLRQPSGGDEKLRQEALAICENLPDGGAEFINLVQRPIVQGGVSAKGWEEMLRRAADYHQVAPLSMDGVGLLGGARYRRGEHRQAIDVIEPAVRVVKDDPIACLFLAAALAKTGRVSEARQLLERARAVSATLNPHQRALIDPLMGEAETVVSSGR